MEGLDFIRGGRVVPAFKGVRLFGNWRRAVDELAVLGYDLCESAPESFDITDGLGAWIPLGRTSPECVSVELLIPD